MTNTDNDVFMTKAQADALFDKFDEAGDEFDNFVFLDYFLVRPYASHDEAMILIDWEVSNIDCDRLQASGGSVHELIELGTLSDKTDVVTSNVIATYIELRCAESLTIDNALSRVYKEYGISPALRV